MEFGIKDAENLAKLSRLEFTEEELKEFLKEFESTLDQVSKINNVDVSNIELTEAEQIDILNLRKDIVCNRFSQKKVIENAPEQKDGAFLVPLTVE